MARTGKLAGGVEGIARGRDAREEEKVVEKDSRGEDLEKGARSKEFRGDTEGVDRSGSQGGSGRGRRGGHQEQGRGGTGGRGGFGHRGRGFVGNSGGIGPREQLGARIGNMGG